MLLVALLTYAASSLHEAVDANNATLLRELLPHVQNKLEVLDENGLTPLHLAAYHGHLEATQTLLDGGVPVDTTSEHGGMTALHWAIGQGHADLVRPLLTKGAQISLTDDGGRNALHFAASRGFDDVLSTLLAEVPKEAPSAVLDAPSNLRVTPLQMAAEKGHAEAVQLLLAAGALPNATADAAQISALHAAAAMGHEVIVDALLRAGSLVEVRDARQRTPLHLAAAMGQQATVKALLEGGAALESRDSDGRTPRWLAERGRHTAVVAMLRTAGAQPGSPIRRLAKRVRRWWVQLVSAERDREACASSE